MDGRPGNKKRGGHDDDDDDDDDDGLAIDQQTRWGRQPTTMTPKNNKIGKKTTDWGGGKSECERDGRWRRSRAR